MLNFSYSFNRAKRRSSDIHKLTHPQSPKNLAHKRSDSIDYGYFPKHEELERKSEGSDTLNSDFREGSRYSADSPTDVKRFSNTGNTSINSQHIIDLNDVEKETSKFKRSLSYPTQTVANRRNSGECYVNEYFGEYIPNYGSRCNNKDHEYILSGNHRNLATRQSCMPAYDVSKMSNRQQEILNDAIKRSQEFPKGIDIDEMPFAGQFAYHKGQTTKETTKMSIFPQASEELLLKHQLKNAGIIDVSDQNEEEEEDDRSDDEFNAKETQDKRTKNGGKKKTFISKTISKLNPGF